MKTSTPLLAHVSRLVLGLLVLVPAAAAQPPVIDCVDTSRIAEMAWRERDLLGELSPPSPMRGPPANPQVGDTWDWYIWDLAGFPQATLEPCTVRGSTPNVYVVVRDADWNVFVTQADVDSVVDHCENRSYGLFPGRGIYSLDAEAFGDPPLGLDLDPKVYLLYHDFTISSDGFAGWADSQPDQGTGLNKSNECEVLYLNCGPDGGVDHDPDGRYMLSVVAHELEHVIHRGHDEAEENWLDESLAEIGMYLFDPYTEFIDGFRANSDISLTLNNPAGSYGTRYFYGMHLYEEYGGPAISRAIVAHPAQGIGSVEAALSGLGFAETFEDVFATWIVANWLDDPRIDGGVHGYDDFDYAPFIPAATHDTYPTGARVGSVSRWAADYVALSGFAPLGLSLSFDGADADRYVVRVLLEDSMGLLLPRVLDLTLDAAADGSLTVPAGTGHDGAVLVVGAADPTGDPSLYLYSAELVAPVDLRVLREAASPTGARLEWTTPATPPFQVLKGAVAETLRASPDVLYSDVLGYAFVDREPAGALVFYSVEPQ